MASVCVAVTSASATENRRSVYAMRRSLDTVPVLNGSEADVTAGTALSFSTAWSIDALL
jgi:hypothetical protein